MSGARPLSGSLLSANPLRIPVREQEAPNARARTLYESLGYLVVNTNMAKSLN